jgi:hypothetical protein
MTNEDSKKGPTQNELGRRDMLKGALLAAIFHRVRG